MGHTILLVDDEAGIRKVLAISLADAGHTVHTAASAREALNLFRELRPPIVLTDIKMPDMDGITLLRKIKEECAETEVIMFTGHGDMQLAIESLKNNATDFVTEPIDDDILGIAINRAAERYSLRRQLQTYTHDLERMVEEKSRKLIDAERMAAVGEAITGLSHTIKNIAGGLKGGVFILGKGIELDEKEYLVEGWDMIKGNVDKIHDLSLALLNYGKYADIHRQAADPNGPAEDAIHFMTPRAEKMGIDLDFRPEKDLPVCQLDKEAVHRCLINLIDNAMDACCEKVESEEKKRIVLEATVSDKGLVTYRVSDNGIGIDEETRGKLFQSFFSTKGTRGTGIGLMMTRKIIHQHGGNVQVESTPEKGSCFTLHIPAVADSGQPANSKVGDREGNDTESARNSPNHE